jgi:hypothetical protein
VLKGTNYSVKRLLCSFISILKVVCHSKDKDIRTYNLIIAINSFYSIPKNFEDEECNLTDDEPMVLPA